MITRRVRDEFYAHLARSAPCGGIPGCSSPTGRVTGHEDEVGDLVGLSGRWRLESRLWTEGASAWPHERGRRRGSRQPAAQRPCKSPVSAQHDSARGWPARDRFGDGAMAGQPPPKRYCSLMEGLGVHISPPHQQPCCRRLLRAWPLASHGIAESPTSQPMP